MITFDSFEHLKKTFAHRLIPVGLNTYIPTLKHQNNSKNYLHIRLGKNYSLREYNQLFV